MLTLDPILLNLFSSGSHINQLSPSCRGRFTLVTEEVLGYLIFFVKNNKINLDQQEKRTQRPDEHSKQDKLGYSPHPWVYPHKQHAAKLRKFHIG